MPWPMLIYLLITHAFIDGAGSSFNALLKRLAQHHQVSDVAIGLVVAVLSASVNFSQPIFGLLYDRFRAYWVLPLSVLVLGICFASVGLANSFGLLLLLVAFGGLASGAFHPAATAMAGSLSHKRKPLTIAIFVSAGALGIGLGPWFISRLVAARGLPATIWLLAVAAPVLIVACLASAAYRKTPHSNRQHSSPAAGLRDGIFSRPLILLYCGALSRAFVAYICYGGMSFLMAEKISDSDAALRAAGSNLALFGLAAGFGGLLSGLLLRPALEKPALIISLILAGPCLLIFPGLSGSYLTAALILGTVILHSTTPMVTAIGQRLLPHSTALASSIFMGASWGVAAVVGSLAVTSLGSSRGYAQAMPFLIAVGLLVSLATTIALPRLIRTQTP